MQPPRISGPCLVDSADQCNAPLSSKPDRPVRSLPHTQFLRAVLARTENRTTASQTKSQDIFSEAKAACRCRNQLTCSDRISAAPRQRLSFFGKAIAHRAWLSYCPRDPRKATLPAALREPLKHLSLRPLAHNKHVRHIRDVAPRYNHAAVPATL